MNYETFIGLVANAAMLLGLSVIHDMIAMKKSKRPTLQKFYMGVLLGLIALAIMANPWRYGHSIIFDTRTILLCISGLFFGFVPTTIAVVMAAIYRISMGGGGVYMGVGTIVSSAAIGLAFRYMHEKRKWSYGFGELYFLGLVTHLVMIFLILTLPRNLQWEVFKSMALPIIIIYPIATVILGWLHATHVQRNNAQEKVRESEELFSSIANTSPPIWMADTTKKCIWFNQSWLDFRGRTLEEEYGDGWVEGVHPDDLDHCISIYTQNFDNRQAFIMEYRLMRHDGKYRWVIDRGKPRYSNAGDFLGYLGTCIDNTELKITEDTLRHTTEEFSQFFNNAIDLFCIASQDGYFIRLNKQWTKTLGYSIEELLHRPFLELVYPEDSPATIEAMEKLGKGDNIAGFVNRYLHKDGTYRWIEWRSYPVGERIFAAARDITEKIEQDKKILRLNRDLESKVAERTVALEIANEELEAFTYSAAHDLKAPLRSISGFNRIIMEDYAHLMDEEGKKLLERISSNVANMESLIGDLLTFAHVSKEDLSITIVDLPHMVQGIYDEICPPEQAKNIEFTVTDLPLVKADKKLFRQVWQNLISNAIKFTAYVDSPQINISGYNTGFANVYVIKDNGIGFDPKYRDQIFGLFKRVHTDQRYLGTGVGLAITKRIISRHKGKIWAESNPGAGTEIFLSIPL